MRQSDKNTYLPIFRQSRKRKARRASRRGQDVIYLPAEKTPDPKDFGVFRGILFSSGPVALFWVGLYCLWRLLRGG